MAFDSATDQAIRHVINQILRYMNAKDVEGAKAALSQFAGTYLRDEYQDYFQGDVEGVFPNIGAFLKDYKLLVEVDRLGDLRRQSMAPEELHSQPMASEPVESGPTIMGIGAPSAGTTWLHHTLSSHPDVWMPPLKELNYFTADYGTLTTTPSDQRNDRLEKFFDQLRDNPDLIVGNQQALDWWWLALKKRPSDDGDAWYRSLFAGRPERERGEVTPEYIHLKTATIRKIRAANPSLKIVLNIRHPVDRALTSARRGLRAETYDNMETAVFDFQSLRNGFYSLHYQRWAKVFPASQIHVVVQEELERDSLAVTQRLMDFLELPMTEELKQSATRRYNVTPKDTVDPELVSRLEAYYKEEVERSHAVFGDLVADWR